MAKRQDGSGQKDTIFPYVVDLTAVVFSRLCILDGADKKAIPETAAGTRGGTLLIAAA